MNCSRPALFAVVALLVGCSTATPTPLVTTPPSGREATRGGVNDDVAEADPDEATHSPPEVVSRLCGSCHLGDGGRGWRAAGMSRDEAVAKIRGGATYSMPSFGEGRLPGDGLDVVLAWLTRLGTVR